MGEHNRLSDWENRFIMRDLLEHFSNAGGKERVRLLAAGVAKQLAHWWRVELTVSGTGQHYCSPDASVSPLVSRETVAPVQYERVGRYE